MKRNIKITVLVILAALSFCACGQRDDFFQMRGAVLAVEDLETADWPRIAHENGINTLGTHITPDQVLRFWESDKGKQFQEDCRRYGIQVEHELHAMSALLPREHFAEDSTMFRMDESGHRTADFNCCASSTRALDTIASRALYYARHLTSTNHRYYFWLDDGAPVCQCPQCRELSASEQALIIENKMLEAIRTYDPKAMLAHLAYFSSLQAPRKVKPLEGIFLEFAPFQRRLDKPITDSVSEVRDIGFNARNLTYLKENLEVFPAETAVVLDYWLDVSMASGWKKPAVELPWDGDVFRSDIATYADLGIRNITTFAVYMDSTYFQAYPHPTYLKEYGDALRTYERSKEDRSWAFKTKYFSIDVNQRGYIHSMKNITRKPCREFSPADKPSPLMSLYDSEKREYYYPEKAHFDKKTKLMTLNYPNGSIARVQLQPHDKYLKLSLVSIEPRNGINAIQWGSYHTNITNLMGEIIGVARDTSDVVNYSIGVLALDDNTLGGTSDVESDAAPFQYIIHTPDAQRFPLPDSLHEGQVFTLGGDGISDVAFYANKEPYYRIMYGNAALVDSSGRISLSYHSRDRSQPRQVLYSLIPNMPVNEPNHIDVEPLPGIDYIGSSIALWGSPDSTALLDVIQDIVLSEHLPYPTIHGKWIKDPTAFSPDVITSGCLYDSIISYTKRLGFPTIHAYDQGFLRPNRANGGYLDGPDQSTKPFRFSSGNKSHREYADMAEAEGLMLGRVCITNSLAPGTMDASPVPSDSLCYQQKRVLMRDISPEDTIIIIDDPTYMEEIASWQGHHKELNMVKIGHELIHYLGVSESYPYRLKNVQRGYWGTRAVSHHALDTVYKLQVTLPWGYEGLIPNMELQDEIAKYYAEVAKHSGVTMYDFDGQEFHFNSGHGYYAAKRFFRVLFEHAHELGVPYIRFSGATLSEASWHYQSVWNVGGGRNMYDLDTREWGSTTSEGKDLRDVTYSNYFPVSFGNNYAIKDTSYVEQYEHVEALAVGYGATYFLSINQEDVEKCPQKERIFSTIRTWEDARHANAFPRSIRKLLMNPDYDWRLEAQPDGKSWLLYQMVDGRNTNVYTLKRTKSK